MKTVAGYVRRSHAGEAVISERVQRDTIAREAKARGLTVGKVYMDWGRTGRLPDDVDGDTLEDILAHRPRALEMMHDIEAGTVGTVLAYRQDRLARDSFTLQLMIRVARRHRAPLIIPRGDITAREQRLLTAVEGGMDEEEGTRAKERSDAAEKTMGERGDERGAAPYGWTRRTEPDGRIVKVLTDPDKPARVVKLYLSLGSYNATARRLNDNGVPPPNPSQRRRSAGPPMWSAATVRDIVLREAPEVTKRAAPIPRRKRSYLFRGLLRCWCGAPMTTSGNDRASWYYCNRGKRGAHQPYAISGSKLRPWIEDEADRLVNPHAGADLIGQVDEPDDDDARRRLEAARDLIGEDAYADALGRLQAEQDAHSERMALLGSIPSAIDWKAWEADPEAEPWSTARVNAVLRAMWDHVELDAQLQPVRAEWRVPEWRT